MPPATRPERPLTALALVLLLGGSALRCSSSGDATSPGGAGGDAAGQGGAAGASAASGGGGSAGHAGSGGKGGSAGHAGSGGKGGSAGHAGSSGKAGSGGHAGSGGKGGQAGSAGESGHAGSAGKGGSAGQSGASGAGAESGSGGSDAGGSSSAGSGGSAGAGGTGAAGGAGGAGAAGGSGAAGTDAGGASGTSGASGAGGGGGQPTCGQSGWETYGHDAQRSFASDGCITGPLAPSWHYTPTAPAGHSVTTVFQALAAPDAVYLHYDVTDPPYTGSAVVDRVALAGTFGWTFDTGRDSGVGFWPSLGDGKLLLEDDGLWLVDQVTGKPQSLNSFDTWGQNVFDGTDFYFECEFHGDNGGTGLTVQSFSGGKKRWDQNTYDKCGEGVSADRGSIALDGDKLYFGINYSSTKMASPPFASGLYSFDKVTGAPGFHVGTQVASALSAGQGMIYLVEQPAKLVARKQSDGSLVWSVDVQGAGVQAPVLAAGKVIVATQGSGVLAFDALSGAPAWSAKSLSAAPFYFTGEVQFTLCMNNLVQYGGAIATTLAAALGTGTLVVTTLDTTVHVLSLSDGAEVWSGAIPGAAGQLHDPVIVGKTLYVADASGLFSLQSP